MTHSPGSWQVQEQGTCKSLPAVSSMGGKRAREPLREGGGRDKVTLDQEVIPMITALIHSGGGLCDPVTLQKAQVLGVKFLTYAGASLLGPLQVVVNHNAPNVCVQICMDV